MDITLPGIYFIKIDRPTDIYASDKVVDRLKILSDFFQIMASTKEPMINKKIERIRKG